MNERENVIERIQRLDKNFDSDYLNSFSDDRLHELENLLKQIDSTSYHLNKGKRNYLSNKANYEELQEIVKTYDTGISKTDEEKEQKNNMKKRIGEIAFELRYEKVKMPFRHEEIVDIANQIADEYSKRIGNAALANLQNLAEQVSDLREQLYVFYDDKNKTNIGNKTNANPGAGATNADEKTNANIGAGATNADDKTNANIGAGATNADDKTSVDEKVEQTKKNKLIAELEEKKKNIKSEMEELLKEINELKEKLNDPNLTEEEKSKLKSQLSSKIEKYNALKKEYGELSDKIDSINNSSKDADGKLNTKDNNDKNNFDDTTKGNGKDKLQTSKVNVPPTFTYPGYVMPNATAPQYGGIAPQFRDVQSASISGATTKNLEPDDKPTKESADKNKSVLQKAISKLVGNKSDEKKDEMTENLPDKRRNFLGRALANLMAKDAKEDRKVEVLEKKKIEYDFSSEAANFPLSRIEDGYCYYVKREDDNIVYVRENLKDIPCSINDLRKEVEHAKKLYAGLYDENSPLNRDTDTIIRTIRGFSFVGKAKREKVLKAICQLRGEPQPIEAIEDILVGKDINFEFGVKDNKDYDLINDEKFKIRSVSIANSVDVTSEPDIANQEESLNAENVAPATNNVDVSPKSDIPNQEESLNAENIASDVNSVYVTPEPDIANQEENLNAENIASAVNSVDVTSEPDIANQEKNSNEEVVLEGVTSLNQISDNSEEIEIDIATENNKQANSQKANQVRSVLMGDEFDKEYEQLYKNYKQSHRRKDRKNNRKKNREDWDDR